MRIFLTGATGYIGLHIVRELLAHGHTLTALARSPDKLGPLAVSPHLRVIAADLENRVAIARALEGQEVVVHAALLWGDPGTELDLRDTAAAARLFDSAGRAGAARCLSLSSAAVHRPFGSEMREEDPLATADLYGATKAAGELFLRAACAEHGMRGVVLRPGPVVGPPAFAGASFRSDARLVEMVHAARGGRALEVPAEGGRQLSDVAMVARAVRKLASLDEPHATYLCVDRAITSWESVARDIVARLRSASEVRVSPPTTNLPVPRFDTTRLEHLLGGPADAREALTAHIDHLASS